MSRHTDYLAAILSVIEGYSTLATDIESGKRGDRDAQPWAGLAPPSSGGPRAPSTRSVVLLSLAYHR